MNAWDLHQVCRMLCRKAAFGTHNVLKNTISEADTLLRKRYAEDT
jgi:hypothetical protein